MAKNYRRYEILLPLKYNDGRKIPDDFLIETVAELETRFGALSLETQRIEGLWARHGQPQPDDLVRVFLDVPDTPANKQFFLDLKERLKARFEQDDIWLTTHPLEVL